MARFCPACGSPLRQGAKFCAQCGAPVPQNAAPPAAPAGSPAGSRPASGYAPPAPAPPRKPSRTGFLIASAAALVILLPAVLAFLGFVRPGWFVSRETTAPATAAAVTTPMPTAPAVTSPAVPVTTAPPVTAAAPPTTAAAATAAATTATTAAATAAATTTTVTTTMTAATTTSVPNTIDDFTEPMQPAQEDFDWMDGILEKGFPDGAVFIEDNLAINGFWKGMHIYMQDGSEIARELVIYEVQAGQRAAEVTVDWQQINYSEGWEDESDQEDMVMNGAYDTGSITCFSENARLDLDRFFELDGIRYAVGVLSFDGGIAYVGLVRP